MLHALPDDGQRYEVIDGVLLVTPAPSLLHQRVVLRLAQIIGPYVEPLGFEVLIAPAAVTWSERTEVQPDLLTLPLVNGRGVERFEDVGTLGLAVEVLSPSTARVDRFTKRREYQRRGVPEYWIVDPIGRSVERWRPGDDEPEICFDSLRWQPRADAEPLIIDLQEFFRRTHFERP